MSFRDDAEFIARRRFLFRNRSFKRSSVRLMCVRIKREIHRMVSAPASMPDTIRVILQSIFKVPKKTAFCEVRNDLGGSQKKCFF